MTKQTTIVVIGSLRVNIYYSLGQMLAEHLCIWQKDQLLKENNCNSRTVYL